MRLVDLQEPDPPETLPSAPLTQSPVNCYQYRVGHADGRAIARTHGIVKLNITGNPVLTACLPAVDPLIGCNQSELTGTESDVVTSAPPSNEPTSDHDYQYGLNGYPVVDLNNRTAVECDCDTATGSFLLIPPEAVADSVKEIAVKTIVEGTITNYVFEAGEEPVTWTLVNGELGSVMMTGDAIERTFAITLNDGNSMIAPVAHIKGHYLRKSLFSRFEREENSQALRNANPGCLDRVSLPIPSPANHPG